MVDLYGAFRAIDSEISPLKRNWPLFKSVIPLKKGLLISVEISDSGPPTCWRDPQRKISEGKSEEDVPSWIHGACYRPRGGPDCSRTPRQQASPLLLCSHTHTHTHKIQISGSLRKSFFFFLFCAWKGNMFEGRTKIQNKIRREKCAKRSWDNWDGHKARVCVCVCSNVCKKTVFFN